MDNFNKVYYDLILESNNMISEGKILNKMIAGLGGLAMTGGTVLGLNELSRIDVPKEPEQSIVQSIELPNDQILEPTNTKKSTKQKLELTEEEYFIARVLYSETSTKATLLEIKMVCQVIANRIGNKNFGGGKIPKNAYDVVTVENAFSCINDSKNSNWEEFKPDLNERTNYCCQLAKFLMRPDVKQLTFFNDKSIVYYHDKSISTPKKWTNKYWRPVFKFNTKNFKFYSVTSNTKGKK